MKRLQGSSTLDFVRQMTLFGYICRYEIERSGEYGEDRCLILELVKPFDGGSITIYEQNLDSKKSLVDLYDEQRGHYVVSQQYRDRVGKHEQYVIEECVKEYSNQGFFEKHPLKLFEKAESSSYFSKSYRDYVDEIVEGYRSEYIKENDLVNIIKKEFEEKSEDYYWIEIDEELAKLTSDYCSSVYNKLLYNTYGEDELIAIRAILNSSDYKIAFDEDKKSVFSFTKNRKEYLRKFIDDLFLYGDFLEFLEKLYMKKQNKNN